MKPLFGTIVIAAAAAVAAPVASQYQGATSGPYPGQYPGAGPDRLGRPQGRQLQLKPPGDFVVGHSQRVGNQQIVEWVPRGQTVKRYTKMITLLSYVPRRGVGPSTFMEDFSNRYRNSCPGTRVSHMSLGGGKTGVRMDCPRSPMTGKPETVFARVVPVYPALALVQYMTTYTTPPGEAAFAREFVGRVSVQ